MSLIRPARATDAHTISDLAIASKAVWGYDETMLRAFRDELRLTAKQLLEQRCYVYDQGGDICGYYTLVERTPKLIELEHIFVAVDRLRQRIGSKLLQHSIATARAGGFLRMQIISDPHAAGFYERHGAKRVGDHQSSIPGRVLPIYEIEFD